MGKVVYVVTEWEDDMYTESYDDRVIAVCASKEAAIKVVKNKMVAAIDAAVANVVESDTGVICLRPCQEGYTISRIDFTE